MRRYLWIFGVLVATSFPLYGCGEQVSQPTGEKGLPVDPPEPTAPPKEGQRGEGAMRSRPGAGAAPRFVAAPGPGLTRADLS